MKKNFKLLLSLLFVSLFISTGYFAPNAEAQDPDYCDVKNATFLVNLLRSTLDVTRTVPDIGTAAMFGAFAGTYGLDADQFMGCGAYIGEVTGMTDSPVTQCSGTDDEVCAKLVEEWGNDELTFNSSDTLADARIRGIRGSLFGVANLIQGVVINEPLPVNFAYYWNQSIAKIPYVNKALAQSVSENYAKMPVIKAVYDIWKVSRNLALALMAVVLLYTGIMIIMRKKVNPQLVVSVQYAIPKILIGIFLILFSYIIGAAITYLAWGLYRGADTLVWSNFSALEGIKAGAGYALILSILVGGVLFLVAGSGGTFLLILLGLGLVVLLFQAIVFFKAFMVYVKMAFSIVTAPFEFVLGTVPGSEARLTDWFMRMGKYLVTLFAIGIIVPVTYAIALSVATSLFAGTGSTELGGLGAILGIISPFIIIIVGYAIALGIEKRIDEMFFNPKRR
jgi:hypothetical protein